MSAAVMVFPQLWESVANAQFPCTQRKGPHKLRLVQACAEPAPIPIPVSEPPTAKLPRALPNATERGNYAFYRKYTEGLLRRCMKRSLECGRVPSMMNREMFRGNVTHYRVSGFDDVVIFVADVEKCVARLNPGQQYLVRKIGMQAYTQSETAAMNGLPLWTVNRRYNEALDNLTRMFLERNLLGRETSELMRLLEYR